MSGLLVFIGRVRGCLVCVSGVQNESLLDDSEDGRCMMESDCSWTSDLGFGSTHRARYSWVCLHVLRHVLIAHERYQ